MAQGESWEPRGQKTPDGHPDSEQESCKCWHDRDVVVPTAKDPASSNASMLCSVGA
jgi:hypothetical protein